MNLKIEIDEITLKELIINYLQDKLGDIYFDPKRIQILVKSKQNYRSEWESADFKAVYENNEV